MKVVSRPLCLSALLAACLIGGPVAAHAADYDLIVCGSGGQPEYEKKFAEWGTRLSAALTGAARRPKENVYLLMEKTEAMPATAKESTIESIKAAIAEIAAKSTPTDNVFVYLVGHGSGMRSISKLHIPGPDLEAPELAAMLKPLQAHRIGIVAGSPSSAGFINALTGPNRIVCSATKSVREENATDFMEFFIQAIEDGSADRDRDDRVSFYEACRQAAALTSAGYEARGLMATEHALIDDNGDGLGTRLFDPEHDDDMPWKGNPKADGGLAFATYWKDFTFPPSVPDDLVRLYLVALDQVEALKLRKSQMEEAAYYRDLEAVLLKAARANAEIRKIIETGEASPAAPSAGAASDAATPAAAAVTPSAPAVAPAVAAEASPVVEVAPAVEVAPQAPAVTPNVAPPLSAPAE